MLEKTDHDRIIEMHAALLGTNGQGGLFRQVEKNTKAIFRIWLAVIVILLSIGGGTFGIVKAVIAISGA